MSAEASGTVIIRIGVCGTGKEDKKMQELRIRFIIQFQLLINLMTKCKNLPELQKRINTVKEKTKKIREELALLGYFDKQKKEDNK